MIHKQCKTCAGWLSRCPEDIALTLYPVEMKSCPRCGDVESTETESDEIPRYKGAPTVAAPKPQKTMF